jgi:hypothetical protein
MAPRRRRPKRRSDLTEEQAAWLRGDYRNAGFVNYIAKEELSALWNAYCSRIIEDRATEFPGTRPGRWWQYTAPEMRKRLGGTGTPCHECLGYAPSFSYGVPNNWLTPELAKLYRGTAKDVHGNPIFPEYFGKGFSGVAIDPEDPPIYESQAAYLKRLGLLLDGELKRLKKADFEPEAVVSVDY